MSAPKEALGKMRGMENMPDLERVREQYLDAETGELVWVFTAEATDEKLADLVPLPEPAGVRSDHFVMPYTPPTPWASSETLREAHLRKRTLLAGPYKIRIWEKG